MARRLIIMSPDKLAFAKTSAFAELKCNNTWLYRIDHERLFEIFFDKLLGFIHVVKLYNPKSLPALLLLIREGDIKKCLESYYEHLRYVQTRLKKRLRGGSIWHSSI